tara:strand:- start:1867 stop:2175 length:309 start_codon:yes stop_codon:yes gene_type:complete
MTIDELIQNFYLQQQQVDTEIESYDTEFADKKLNPYGVTTIEFEKRSQAIKKKSQLEGAIDALLICKRDVLGDDSEVSIPNNLEVEGGGGNEEMEIIGGSSS